MHSSRTIAGTTLVRSAHTNLSAANAVFRKTCPRFQIVVLVLCLFVMVAPARSQTSNGVLREVYLNIPGGTIADLTGSPTFPASPSLETIQPRFEAPTEFAENYGQRMRAPLIPPLSGAYTF